MTEKWEEMKQDKKKKEEGHRQGEGGGGDKIKDRKGEGDRYRGKDGCRAAPECRGWCAM